MATPRMTIEERFARDGSRWRYIAGLEHELEKCRTRRAVLWVSLALNALAFILLAGGC